MLFSLPPSSYHRLDSVTFNLRLERTQQAMSVRNLFYTSLQIITALVAIGVFVSASEAQSGSRPIRNRPPRSQSFEERPVQKATEPISDISVAREKAREAKKKFESVKKLSRLGSASKKQVRDAELIKWLSILELSNLVSPEKTQENLLLRAKLIYNYRNKELEVIKKLYERGSASNLQYQRAKTNRDIAKSQLKAVQSESDAQRKIYVIGAASSKYQEAQKEHQLAAELFQSGSLSQAAMSRANRNLEAAKSELAEAKKSLGAQASQVGQ